MLQPITKSLRNSFDGFISRSLDRTGKAFSASRIFAGESRQQTEVPWGRWVDYNWDQYERLVVANAWAYSNIKMIGESVSGGELQFQKHTTDPENPWEEIPFHPLIRVLEEHPNPYMTANHVWKFNNWWLQLRGEAYTLLVPDIANTNIVEIYPLPANRIMPITSSTGYIAAYAYWPLETGNPEIIPPEFICYHRYPNPFEYHRGLSPLFAYLSGLKVDVAASEFDLEDFESGLAMKHIISTRPEVNTRDFEVFRSEINDAQRRKEKYLVARGGDISVAPVANRRESGEHNTVRDMSLREANRVYGVPEALFAKNVNMSTSEVARTLYAELTLWPLFKMLAADITLQVVHPFYGMDVRVMFKDPRPRNVDTDIKTEDDMRQVQSFNESRRAKGLDDWPDPEIGEAPFTVAAEIAKAKAVPAPEPFGGNPGESDEDEQEEEEEPTEAEVKSDMNKWRKAVMRRYKEDSSTSYDFQSDVIPPQKVRFVKELLQVAASEADVKAAFDG